MSKKRKTSPLWDILNGVVSRHDERMENDPKYKMMCDIMKEATKTVEPSKHYDRDGYCDNQGRGY